MADDLKLKGASRKVWLRVRKAVRAVTETSTERTEYRVTGGAVLGARWDHRESTDIDIRIDGEGRADEAVKDIAEKANGRVNIDTFGIAKSIQFDDFDEKERVDAITSGTMADIESTDTRLEGELEPVATTAEVLYTKMAGRGERPPARDAMDIAMALSKEPRALERAVNALDARQYYIVRKMYEDHAKVIEEDSSTLMGLSDEAKALVPELSEHARRAIETARYRTFTVTVNGEEKGAVVRTESEAGAATTVWRNAEETAGVLRRNWYDKAITAARDSARAVTREIESALKENRKWSLTVVERRARPPLPAPDRPAKTPTTPTLWDNRPKGRDR